MSFLSDFVEKPLGSGSEGLGGLVIGAGLAAMGVPPGMAALYTGGATAALTGSLQKGLFAGMGAYGAAGMMGGLASLGEGALADQALGSGIDANVAGVQQVGGPGLENSVQGFTSPEVASAGPTQLGGPDMAQTIAPQPSPIAADKIALPQTTTPAPGLEGAAQRLSNAGQGLSAATSKGGLDALSAQMAANGGPSLGMAAGVGALGALGARSMAQPSVTAGAKQSPGYIRQFTYDPYGQRYNALTPVAADQWGSRSFQDAFKAADGGIVALAKGGAVAHFDAGGGVSDAEIKAYVAAHQDDPAAIASAAQQYGVSTADLSRVTGYTPEQVGSYFSNAGINFGAPAPAAPAQAATAAPAAAPVDVNANINNWLQANPNATYQQMRDAASSSGLTDQQILDAYNKSGYSAADQNVTMNKDWANAQGQTGYQGLNANINNWLEQYPTATKADALQAMLDSGLNEKDVIRATGKTLAQLFDEKKKAVTPLPTVPTNGIDNTPSVAGVSTATPGDVRTNANGSTTVTPNIPGRPDQGFTGVQQVKDVYTQGGGSLGYTPYTPKTAAEHEALYNTQTGGSKAAYDYLMGRGAYPTVPSTPTGEIMKPYAESVLGVPSDNTRFAQRFNPATRKYEANPDYKPFLFNQDTGQTTRGMNQAELKDFVKDPANLATPPSTATGWLASLIDQMKNGLLDRPVWMAKNNISYEQLASALGISVAEAKKKYPVNAPAATTTATDTSSSSSSDSGGGNAKGGIMRLANGGISVGSRYDQDIDGIAQNPPDVPFQTTVGNFAAGGLGTLGGYSDGGRLLKGPGDGVSDSIPASIGDKQPARLADGEFVIPARIVSELGNGSTDAGARKLYQMMDRVQKARGKTTGKGKVATNSRADKHLPV